MPEIKECVFCHAQEDLFKFCATETCDTYTCETSLHKYIETGNKGDKTKCITCRNPVDLTSHVACMMQNASQTPESLFAKIHKVAKTNLQTGIFQTVLNASEQSWIDAHFPAHLNPAHLYYFHAWNGNRLNGDQILDGRDVKEQELCTQALEDMEIDWKFQHLCEKYQSCSHQKLITKAEIAIIMQALSKSLVYPEGKKAETLQLFFSLAKAFPSLVDNYKVLKELKFHDAATLKIISLVAAFERDITDSTTAVEAAKHLHTLFLRLFHISGWIPDKINKLIADISLAEIEDFFEGEFFTAQQKTHSGTALWNSIFFPQENDWNFGDILLQQAEEVCADPPSTSPEGPIVAANKAASTINFISSTDFVPKKIEIKIDRTKKILDCIEDAFEGQIVNPAHLFYTMLYDWTHVDGRKAALTPTFYTCLDESGQQNTTGVSKAATDTRRIIDFVEKFVNKPKEFDVFGETKETFIYAVEINTLMSLLASMRHEKAFFRLISLLEHFPEHTSLPEDIYLELGENTLEEGKKRWNDRASKDKALDAAKAVLIKEAKKVLETQMRESTLNTTMRMDGYQIGHQTSGRNILTMLNSRTTELEGSPLNPMHAFNRDALHRLLNSGRQLTVPTDFRFR